MSQPQPTHKTIKFKAQRDIGFGESKIDHLENPFTKILRNKLGPEFNYTNFINKNLKMFQNMSMLDGIAMCGEDDDYQRTYLDQIKIKHNYIQENFYNRPVHIDKLFANEDVFLDQPIGSSSHMDLNSASIEPGPKNRANSIYQPPLEKRDEEVIAELGRNG